MSDFNTIKRQKEPRTTRIDSHTTTTGKPLLKKLREARAELGTSSDQQTIQILYDFWRLNK